MVGQKAANQPDSQTRAEDLFKKILKYY